MQTLKDPVELEQLNRQIMIRKLDNVYSTIEKLIQRTYLKKETELNFQLRNLRTTVSNILADMKDKSLDNFSGKKGSLGDFYAFEDELLSESSRMDRSFSSFITSNEPIDIFKLENMLENFKKILDERIIVDKEMMNEFRLKQMEVSSSQRVMSSEKNVLSGKDFPAPISELKERKTALDNNKSGTAERSRNILAPSLDTQKITVPKEVPKDDIETDVLSNLYNHMNALEHKYSTYQPEILFNGDYIGDRKWKVSISDRKITGTVNDSILRQLIIFETSWNPFSDLRAIMQFIQKEANKVPKGQYKSLCLLSSEWGPDIEEWAEDYAHPRLVLYLYNLGAQEIYFNRNIENSDTLKVWHDSGIYIDLENQIGTLMEKDEPFDASDVAERTGLNKEGAERFLSRMLSRNMIIDVGFGEPRYKSMKNNR